MRSKRTLLLGIFLALVAVIPVRATQVTTAPGFGPYFISEGGEFTMIPDAGVAALLVGYSPLTRNIVTSGSFQTFCVERNEYILPNTTYDVTPNALNQTVFSARPLTIGAEYLYQQFAMGTLPFYNFTDSPAGSRVGFTASHGTAYELQRAISYYMGEYGFDQYNIYMNGTVPIANAFGIYTGNQVRILNLWAPGQPKDQAHAFQDVLILTVPEPSAFALAGLGAAALLAFRRRK